MSNKYKKKTLYFNSDNEDVYDYLCSRKDISDYLCNLVRKDLGTEKKDVVEEVSKIFSELKLIKDKISSISSATISTETIKVEDIMDVEDSSPEVEVIKTSRRSRRVKYKPSMMQDN